MTKVDAPKGSFVQRGLKDQAETALGSIEVAGAKMWKGSAKQGAKPGDSVVRVTFAGNGVQGASISVLLDVSTARHLVEALSAEIASAPR